MKLTIGIGNMFVFLFHDFFVYLSTNETKTWDRLVLKTIMIRT